MPQITLSPSSIKEIQKAKCKKCGGKCCKHAPGLAAPSDFEDFSIESLKKAFLTGLWVWDYQLKSMRPKTTTETIKNFVTTEYNGKRGRCIALTGKGCLFPEKTRPLECKGAIPRGSWKRLYCQKKWRGKIRLVKKAIALAKMK